MVKPNVFIDAARIKNRRETGGGGWAGSVQMMPVTDPAPCAGMVEVRTPEGNVLRVNADDGVYARGVEVPVLIAEDGRALRVGGASEIPSGVPRYYVGESAVLAGVAYEERRAAWEETKRQQLDLRATDASARAANQVAELAKQAGDLNAQAIAANKAVAEAKAQAIEQTVSANKTAAESAHNANAQAITANKSAADAKAAKLQADLEAEAARLTKLAQDAMKAGQLAQQSADGKGLIAYSTFRPAASPGQKVIWFNPGGKPEIYDGGKWRSIQPGDGVVPALDIGTATVGELNGIRIKAGTASFEILIPGNNARFTSSGLTIYHPLPPNADGSAHTPEQVFDWENRQVALNLTSEGERFISVANQSGMVTASMSPDGTVSGRSGIFAGPVRLDALEIQGVDLDTYIALRAKRIIGTTFLEQAELPAGVDSASVAKSEIRLKPGTYEMVWEGNLDRLGGSTGEVFGTMTSAYTVSDAGETLIVLADGADYSAAWGGGASTYAARNVMIFRLTTESLVRFYFTLGSWAKRRVIAYPSTVTLSAFPAALEMGHEMIQTTTTPPAATEAAWKTCSMRLISRQYAWGTSWVYDGTRRSSGEFRWAYLQGKQIRRITVYGRTRTVRDQGVGTWVNFRCGGEVQGVTLYDYSDFELTFTSTGPQTMSTDGVVWFAVDPKPGGYGDFDADAFQAVIEYKE